MGALVTRMLRPIKSYNIENRAHRVISKEKPTPAPTFAHNLEDLKRTLEVEPNIDDKLDKKDEGLDGRLRDVYVTSFGRPEDDITREKQEKNKTRPLPQDRKMMEEYDYGFKEPDQVKYGHTTMRSLLTFLSAHQINPAEVTHEKIALEYKLKEDDVANILKYFKTYEVYIPETKTAPAVFAGPAMMRKQLYKIDSKEIEDKKDKDPIDSVVKAKVSPRDGSVGAGSIGAASLGARRDAPAPKQAPSVRSDERPLATQGDMLNSIKFQRRYRDSLHSDKPSSVFNINKTSLLPREKASIKHVNSKTSTVTRQSINHEFTLPHDKPIPGTMSRNFFSPARPSSPKGRRSPHTPSFN